MRLRHFLLVVMSLVASINSQNVNNGECDLTTPLTRCPLNVLFVLDGSDNVSPNGFNQAKQATTVEIRKLVDSFADTHVGVMTFSESTVEPYTMALQQRTPVQVTTLINDVPTMKQPLGQSVMAKALSKAMTNLQSYSSLSQRQSFGGGRGNNVIVLITDGLPTDTWKVVQEAKSLRDNGIFIVGMSVEDTQSSLLQHIANTIQNCERKINWNSFVDCPATVSIPVPNNSGCRDVLMVVHESDSVLLQENTVRQFLAFTALRYRQVSNSVGVAVVGIDITVSLSSLSKIQPMNDKQSLAQRIRTQLRFPSFKALDVARTVNEAVAMLDRSQSGKSSAIILVIDTRPANVYSARQAITNAKNRGYPVILIGVGDALLGDADLATFGRDALKTYYVDSFSGLFAIQFDDSLCLSDRQGPDCDTIKRDCVSPHIYQESKGNCSCVCPNAQTCTSGFLPAVLDPETCKCKTCIWPKMVLNNTCACQTSRQCPNGFFDKDTCQCAKCPSHKTIVNNTCVCPNEQFCTRGIVPAVLDPDTCKCETCVSPKMIWNNKCVCQSRRQCHGDGFFNNDTCQCVECPLHKRYVNGTCVCPNEQTCTRGFAPAVLDPDTCKCETCVSPKMILNNKCVCQSRTQCRDGFFNNDTCQCAQCPSHKRYFNGTCVCPNEQTCTRGFAPAVLDPDTCKCETCVSPKMIWNNKCVCRSNRQCHDGFFNRDTCQCVECPLHKSIVNNTCVCPSTKVCRNGAMNPDTCQCESCLSPKRNENGICVCPSYISCPNGIINPSTCVCKVPRQCQQGYTLDVSTEQCVCLSPRIEQNGRCVCTTNCPRDAGLDRDTCACLCFDPRNNWNRVANRCEPSPVHSSTCLHLQCANNGHAVADCNGRCQCLCSNGYVGARCEIKVEPRLCDDCTFSNGNYLAGVKGYCHLFVMCMPLFDMGQDTRIRPSKFTPHIRTCAPGTFFVQKPSGWRGCSFLTDGVCTDDQCQGNPLNGRYANVASCRSYWQCDGSGRTISEECCPQGQSFNALSGECRRDANCEMPCGQEIFSSNCTDTRFPIPTSVPVTFIPCRYSVNPNDPNEYYDTASPSQRRRCASGQVMNRQHCTCMPSKIDKECRPTVNMTFDTESTSFEDRVPRTTLTGHKGMVAEYTGDDDLTFRQFASSGFYVPYFEINVRVRLTDTRPHGQRFAIVTNADCNVTESVSITMDGTNFYFKIVQLDGKPPAEIVIPYSGRQDNDGFYSVKLIYRKNDGAFIFTGSVGSFQEEYKGPMTLTDYIDYRLCAIHLGTGFMYQSFEGYFDDLQIWRCEPKTL